VCLTVGTLDTFVAVLVSTVDFFVLLGFSAVRFAVDLLTRMPSTVLTVVLFVAISFSLPPALVLVQLLIQ
jgi:hypothetical protein